MTIWEYAVFGYINEKEKWKIYGPEDKIIEINQYNERNNEVKFFCRVINKMATEGWELIEVTTQHAYMFFRRPKHITAIPKAE